MIAVFLFVDAHVTELGNEQATLHLTVISHKTAEVVGSPAGDQDIYAAF